MPSSLMRREGGNLHLIAWATIQEHDEIERRYRENPKQGGTKSLCCSSVYDLLEFLRTAITREDTARGRVCEGGVAISVSNSVVCAGQFRKVIGRDM